MRVDTVVVVVDARALDRLHVCLGFNVLGI
jgi:hypothetical protein